MSAPARRREHRSFDVQTERHTAAGAPAGSRAGPGRQRGTAHRFGAGDHRRDERRDAVPDEGRAELVDAVRLGRHVDAVGAVDLHVDEPGDDPPTAGVDIDRPVTAADAA